MKKVKSLFMANQLPNENATQWVVGANFWGEPITVIRVFSSIGDLMSHYMIFCDGKEVALVNSNHVESIIWDTE